MRNTDYRQAVTDAIVEKIEKGESPFRNMYEKEPPINGKTGKPYNGINSVLLSNKEHLDQRWYTYKQAQEVGAQVKKGEKSTTIEYWKWQDKVKNEKTGKMEYVDLERPKVFYAKVFNAEQIAGLPEYEKRTISDEEKSERISNIIENSQTSLRVAPNETPSYSPAKDEITMPKPEQFKTQESYHAVYLHELAHSTGHKNRLNRDLSGKDDIQSYAKEELRAELASAMLSQELGLKPSNEQMENHAGYIKSWASVLKEDRSEIFRASKEASKIADYVMEMEKSKDYDKNTMAKNSLKSEYKENPEKSKDFKAITAIDNSVSKLGDTTTAKLIKDKALDKAFDNLAQGKSLAIKKVSQKSNNASAEIER